jgi:hypothetical protein
MKAGQEKKGTNQEKMVAKTEAWSEKTETNQEKMKATVKVSQQEMRAKIKTDTVKGSWHTRLTNSLPSVSQLCRKCGCLDIPQPYGLL